MKFLVTLILIGISFSARAQGTLNFANLAGGGAVNAPIIDQSKGNVLAEGPNVVALLYTAPFGTLDRLAFEVVGSPVPLSTGVGAGYFLGPTDAVAVPGYSMGAPIALFVRAFDTTTGSSYDTASLRGESNIVGINLGGAIAIPANLVGLQGFSIKSIHETSIVSVNPVPEPSAVAFCVMLTTAVWLRNRRT